MHNSEMEFKREIPMESSDTLMGSGSGSGSSGVKLVKLTVQDVKTICLGVIGRSNGLRFCCRHACNVASHKSQKVTLREDETRYYIAGPRDGQSFTVPSLPVSKVESKSDREMLESVQKPATVWKTLFQRFEANTTNNLESHDERGMIYDADENVNVGDQLRVIEAAKDGFKTPKRTRFNPVTDIMEIAVDTQPVTLPKRARFGRLTDIIKSEDPDETKIRLVEQIVQQWDDIIIEIETIRDILNQSIMGDQKFREKIIQQNMELHSGIEKSEDMSRLLQSEIGESDSAFDGMTIWEILSKTSGDHLMLKKDLDSVKPSMVLWDDFKNVISEVKEIKSSMITRLECNNIISQDKSKMEQIAKNLIAFKNHYTKSFNSFKLQLSKLGNQVLREDQGNERYGYSTGGFGNEDQVSRTTNLEEAVSSLTNDLQDLKNSFISEGTETDYEKLNARVKEIESRVSGESVSINHGEFIFTSEMEVGLWLDKEGNTSMGIFWDIFSALVAMAPKRLSGKERADQQYSSGRIHTTTAENELAASMAYERPQTLYGDKNGNICSWEDGFGSCKTHDKWVLGSQSFKTQTTKTLKKFLSGIAGNISHKDGGSSLAKVLLNEVSSQWNEVTAFIDSFFQDLTETAHFPKQKAWTLVGQCCGAIFDVMEPYRAVVSQLEDLNCLASRAKFLWCILQCHRVMQDFVSKDFRGHPQMVKQISLFMINERVDPVAFNKMEEKVKTQSSIIDSMEKQMTQMKRTLGGYEGLRKELSDLQKEVKKKKINEMKPRKSASMLVPCKRIGCLFEESNEDTLSLLT